MSAGVDGSSRRSRRTGWAAWRRPLLGVLLVAAFALLARWLGPDWIAAEGSARRAVSPLPFVLLYSLGVIALIPGSLLALAAGAAFGWRLGLLVAVIGANLGAMLSFGIARGFGHDLAWRLLLDRVPDLDAKVREHAFESIFVIRLLSIVPFVNYSCGLTSMRLRDFALASFLGMFPSLLGFVLLGSNLDARGPAFWLTLLLVLVIAALPLVVRRRTRVGRPRADDPMPNDLP